MNSINIKCQELKEQYDACFNAWLSEKFLKGKGDAEKLPCPQIFLDYQKCVRDSLADKDIDIQEVEKKINESREKFKDLA